jgi:hypothetical protein
MRRLYIIKIILVLTLSTSCNTTSNIEEQLEYKAIYSGTQWIDDLDKEVSAHGAGIFEDNRKYYLFGEKKSDTSNAFTGFNCYSSTDLYNWKFESLALPIQDSGRLGPDRVGERVKVMKSPATGEYIMFMHTDDLGYRDPIVGYATSENITGPYTFEGPLLFKGKPIRKWDMGTFQDDDGTGYLLIHGGIIFRLSDDYKSISQQVLEGMCHRCESPAVFKKDGVYFFLGSDLTSWERNDNTYHTASSLEGPWTMRGNFAPEGTLTWNSQTTLVFPIIGTKDTTYMFMGDRWAFPRQNSAATYVWQPLSVSGTSLSMPEFREAWQINTVTGIVSEFEIEGKKIDNSDKGSIKYYGQWEHSSQTNPLFSDSRSDVPEAGFMVPFKGSQIAMYGISRPDGGYAHVMLQNDKEETILSSVIDMYSKYPVSSLKFISPVMEKDNYVLKVSVIAEHGKWPDKKGTVYGSTGNFVSVDKILIKE